MREWTQKHIEELIDKHAGGGSKFSQIPVVVPPTMYLTVSFWEDGFGGELEITFTRSYSATIKTGFHYTTTGYEGVSTPRKGRVWRTSTYDGECTLVFSDSPATGLYMVDLGASETDLWPYGGMVYADKGSADTNYKEQLSRTVITNGEPLFYTGDSGGVADTVRFTADPLTSP